MYLLRSVLMCLCLAAAFRVSAEDSVVVFNEVMYQGERGSLEWLELHNQMAVDVELSNWRLDGVTFTFPTNTILAGGGYLVVASDPAALLAAGATNVLGPMTGRLDNSGERLRLINHNGRIMDVLRYTPEEPWPPGAAGSGFSLAKNRPTLATDDARNWSHSAEIGGTPGRGNFPLGPTPRGIEISEISGLTNSAFHIEVANRGNATVDVSGYQFAATPSLVRHRVPPGTVLTPGSVFTMELGLGSTLVGEKLFLFGPEQTNLLDAVTLKLQAQARDAAGNWYYPPNATFGLVNLPRPPSDVVINEIMYRNEPLDARPASYTETVVLSMDASWRFNQSGNVPANWMQPNFNDTGWNSGRGLLAAETAALPDVIRTPLTLGPISYYFRTEFNFSASTNGAEFFIEHVIDDGAVFYLNGREIYRFNMPEGAVTSSTTATPGVPDAVLVGPVVLSASGLVPGRNVLAVEVHQGSSGSSDVVFGCRVGLRVVTSPARPFSESTENWIELFNKGTNRVDLSGWEIDAVSYRFPTNSSIEPGGYLVVAQDAAAMIARYPSIQVAGSFEGQLSRSTELVRLISSDGNVADEVRYFDGPPWPENADGHGASLELRDPHADNSKAEAWSASVEWGEWKNYQYSDTAAPDNGPTRWNEFVLGLLDAGELLLDDISVIENPGTAGARSLIRNGNFENGTASWRFLGTHRNARVVEDSDSPGNHVLHLVADGPTEHMHNHVETTLTNNVAVQNGNTYLVSFRAKTLAGCNLLNTRVYFNRVARTTVLERPAAGGTPGRRNSTAVENLGPTYSDLRHAPIHPAANVPVEVTVSASDPDGIARIDLWWAPNGGGWTNALMELNAGTYRASIPGFGGGRTVQFYIEAVDQKGARSVYPRGGASSRALYKVGDPQTLSPRLHNFRIVMVPTEATALHAATNVMSNGSSRCTVVYNEQEVFYDCELHLQGSQRGRNDSSRVGFTVSFPADRPFRGVHDTITFDRSGGYSGRGGRQDEIVLRHIINQAGDSPDMYNDLVRVLTPLNTHSGTAMLAMAKYGDDYIDGSVYESDGGLFKLELIYYPTTSVGANPEAPKLPQPDEVTGVDIGDLGDSPEDYRWFLLAENRPWRNDYARLMEFAKAFGSSGPALETATAEWMDMEQWTRVFALKSLSGDPDTYGFGLPHNQLVYIPPTGKALTFPWDLDFAWARSSTDSINVGSKIGQIIHGIPANERLFLGHLDDILRSSFNTSYLSRWTTHYGALAGQNYSGILTWIGQRANYVRGQLPVAGPMVISVPGASPQMLEATNEVVLRGTAPYTMKRVRVKHGGRENAVNWTARENWETRLALAFGQNEVEFIGYNFRNQPVATNSFVITSTTPHGRPDADGDGMPDDWEIAHGLNPTHPDPGADRDLDLFPDLAEYYAGTRPDDSNSRLLLDLGRNGADLELAFPAMAGRAYRIQSMSSLGSGWQDVLNVPAAAQDRVVRHAARLSSEHSFYRLVVDVPPAN